MLLLPFKLAVVLLYLQAREFIVC